MKHIKMSLFAMILAFSACSKEDNQTELDCSLVLCTTEFRSITVELVNGIVLPPGSPYFIERMLEGSDKLIEVTNEIPGKFVVLDDSHRSLLKPEGTNIVVKVYRVGFAGNDLMNTSNYVIGYDCCHINKISGPDSIDVQ